MVNVHRLFHRSMSRERGEPDERPQSRQEAEGSEPESENHDAPAEEDEAIKPPVQATGEGS